MKRFFAGVLTGFVATSAVALASPEANHDGMFWNKLNPAAKNGYISGYADATRVTVSKLDTLIMAGDLFHWKGSRTIIHEVETELSRSELAPKDAVSRLDTLYKNQSYRGLDLSSALQLTMALRPQANRAGGSSAK
jgi:hypothetical protein